ncbi:permease prefix domain 1-containing protein [Chloroflexota bacterium]
MIPEIIDYLDEVKSHLRLNPESEKPVIRELHTHFQEKMGELQEAGFSKEDACRAAVESFGRSRVVARRMYEAHSKGSWIEAAIASLPHLVFVCLFVLHLWLHPVLTPILLVAIVAVTLYGWWHGKPSWLYTWIGYALLPLLVGAYICASLLWGPGSFPSVWAVLVILAFILFSIWAILLTTIGVVRRDWILASLMLVPLPVFGGWLLNLENGGGLLRGGVEVIHKFDMAMAGALIALAVTSAAFIRLRQRVMKIGALISIGIIAMAVAAHGLWGGLGFFGLLATALLLVAFLLSPALLEARVGHGERGGEMWWGNGWLKSP